MLKEIFTNKLFKQDTPHSKTIIKINMIPMYYTKNKPIRIAIKIIKINRKRKLIECQAKKVE